MDFQVLTRDSVTISVDAVVYYRVSNSTLCKTSVENAHHSTMLLSQVTVLMVIMITMMIKVIVCTQFHHGLFINQHYYHQQKSLVWTIITV